MNATLTGHPKVDAIAQINFEGDITPKSWYRHICYQTKQGEQKADRLAIDILSDIVYWYRPYQKRHELTGEIVGWQKKFTESALRRSPDAFAEGLNASVRCVRESIRLLERMGLITVILQPVRTAYGVIPNVMHIDINPKAIADITYRPIPNESPETIEKSLLTKWVTRSDEMGNNHLRDRQQSRTKPSEPPTKPSQEVNETVESSIYRDFSEISLETSKETSSPLTPLLKGGQGEGEAIAVDVEIVEEEPLMPPPFVEEKVISLLRASSVNSKDQRPARQRDNSKQVQNLIEKFESGQITRLPPFELKMLADEMIGDYVRSYRRSGNIICSDPNDMSSDFLMYVAKNHLSAKIRNSSHAASRVSNIEQEPTKWRSLIEMVEGWLQHRQSQTCSQGNKTATETVNEFDDFMDELLKANA